MPEIAEKLQPALLHVGIVERTDERRRDLPWRRVRRGGVSGHMLGNDGDVLAVSSFREHQCDVEADDTGSLERSALGRHCEVRDLPDNDDAVRHHLQSMIAMIAYRLKLAMGNSIGIYMTSMSINLLNIRSIDFETSQGATETAARSNSRWR